MIEMTGMGVFFLLYISDNVIMMNRLVKIGIYLFYSLLLIFRLSQRRK